MSITATVFEIIRGFSFYLVCGVAIVLCYNILGFILGLDFYGKSKKNLVISFIIVCILLYLDNIIFSIYHVHLINTKIALGATPDTIF